MNRRQALEFAATAATGGVLASTTTLAQEANTSSHQSTETDPISGPAQATLEAMSKGPLPAMADFRHQVVLGPFEPDIKLMHPEFSPHGLVLDGAWLYAQFRDEDNNIYSCIRKVAGYWTGGVTIFTNADTDQLSINPKSATTYKGGLEVNADDTSIIWSSGFYQPDPTQAFHYTQTKNGGEWQEGDILNVKAKLLQPGMQWYDPNKDGGFYALHIHQAEGEILGKKVKGWFGFDFIYHPPHRPWHIGPYPNRLEVAYHTIANEYDDGSLEVGMMCHGREGWSFAILSDGKNLTHCARDVDVQIVRREDGFPEEVLYMFDNVEYHWRADPNGRLIDHMAAYGGAYRGSEGHCQRVGDTRKIVNGQGWIDFFSDDRVAGKLVDKITFRTQ